MDAELMGAPRARIEQHMRRHFPITTVDLVFGGGVFGTVRTGRKRFSFFGIPADSQFYEAMPLLRTTADESLIHADNRVVLELGGKSAVHRIALGNDHHS